MLADIHELSIRAILGGFLLIACCIIALSVGHTNESVRRAIFIVLSSTVALVSGILLATALYVIQNPLNITKVLP